MVIAMASVASAGHKLGHSPGGGGGGSSATLGDLNCTVDHQIARFNDGSGAWECSDGLTVNEAAAATAQSTANTAASNAADAQSRVTTLEGQILDGRVTDLETDVGDLQAAGGGTIDNILSPVLVDGNLEPIGTVVGVIGQLEVIIVVDVQNAFGDTRLTILEVYWDDDADYPFKMTRLVKDRVRFDGLGCTGRAFITLSRPWNRISGNVFASALMRSNDANAEWYVATSTESEPFVARSQLGSNQTCFSVGPFDVQGMPVEQVEVNIFDRFPLPYSLDFR